jgi:5-dehydro-4-deoxyglucarate dehydratase
MQPDVLCGRLRGAIAFPVTPFRPDLTLDAGGLRRNLDGLLKHPIAAVVAAGGTGELYSLMPAEQLEVVRTTVEVVKARAPVIAGVGINAPLAVEMARQSAEAGADAILALPPYYPGADDEGLIEYYAAIGAATELPLLVYSRDWVNPAPAWVERLLARVPRLTAWKDGQGDVRRYQMIMHRLGPRLHWIGGAGDDCVPGYYSLGIRAYTSSIATVAPRLSIELHETAAAGEAEHLKRLMDHYVIPLYALRARRKGYEVTVMKEMMNAVGLAAGPVRPPLPPLRPEDAADLRVLIERYRPMVS